MAMIFGSDTGGADRFAALDRSAKMAQEIFNSRNKLEMKQQKNFLYK